MGRREAAWTEDRIQLDEVVRVKVYTERSTMTGNYGGTATADVRTWAAVEREKSMLDIRSDGSTLYEPAAFVLRYNALWATLDGRHLEIEHDGDKHRVTGVQRIGRRRFLRLEVKA